MNLKRCSAVGKNIPYNVIGLGEVAEPEAK